MLLLCTVLFLLSGRKKLEDSGNEISEPKKIVMDQVYEDPDKLGNKGQGNYELTQCPAYESTTSKPQPTEVNHDNDYEL